MAQDLIVKSLVFFCLFIQKTFKRRGKPFLLVCTLVYDWLFFSFCFKVEQGQSWTRPYIFLEKSFLFFCGVWNLL